MLLAFVIALGIGAFVLFANGVELAAGVMIVSFTAICWTGDRLGS
jgi:hypothetical protein